MNIQVPNKDAIEFTEKDYRDYQHEEGDVVYCDPPYYGFYSYDGTEPFDHEAFYDWLRTRDYPVYFSEYTAPEDFVSIWEKDILRLFSGAVGSVGRKARRKKATEHLFIHRKWLNGEIERIVEQIAENTGNGGK